MRTLDHDGCSLAYRVSGSGPPVLFIQGVGVHGDGWAPQTEALGGRFTCLSFDNRGMGQSQPLGPGPLTVERLVADALALVDAERWDRFHVVGHSMGGHVATALALRHRERVRSLALLCTSARGKDMPPVTASFLWTSVRSRVGTRRARRRAFLEMVLPRSIRQRDDLDGWAARLAPIFGHDLAETPAVVMKQIRAYRAHDAREGSRGLADLPTLVVGAAEDPLSPPALGRDLARSIPGARLVEIEDASHGVTITHAERVNTLLGELFEAAGEAA